MNISKVSVKRPVATLMVVIVVMLFGFISLAKLNTDLLPNMNIPVALVLTTYDGCGSEEIKELITEPIESAMGTVSGIDTITSQSNNGSSIVILQFDDDVDIDLAAVDIREKIDLIKRMLPDDADDPMIVKIDINSMSSLQVAAFSEKMDIIELNDIVEDSIADRLERQNGVASVSVSGGREKEIQVVVKADKLRGYGISESTVASVLYAENSNTPSGSVDKGNKNMTVRVDGEFETVDEIENIPITTSTGSTVYIRDIAEVSEVYQDVTSSAYTNKVPSVNLTIQKQSTANTVNVSKVVLEELEKVKEDYPDIHFLVVNDPADYINNAISNVVDTAVQGGILAVIVLYIFLRNFKSTMVVGISMPVSIIATFALMYFSGMTLNMMSLGGLVLGIGMLVDSSIVVLESIYKKLEEGEDKFIAAIEGAREVVPSVVASTLTTVGVFIPVVFVEGMAGQMFKDLSLTICFSLLASVVVSITFVPMACSVFLKPEDVANIHRRKNIFTTILDAIGHGISSIEVGYKILLDKALNHRKITLLVVVAFLVLTGACFPFMGFDFMTSSDEGIVNVSVTLPKGTKLADTEKITWQIIDAIEDEPEIVDMSFSIGGGSMSVLTGASEDSSSITINLLDKQERDRSSDEIAQSMRKKVKDIAGAEIDVSASSSSMGSYSSSGLTVNIIGDDLDKLSAIADDFADKINTVANVTNAKSSVEDATPQLSIKVNRDKASSYGISSSSISSIVKTAISGTTATTYKIDGDEYDIVIMQDGDKVNFITDVESILIPTATGSNVPLREIAELKNETVPATITREDQETYVSVTANIENGVSTTDINKAVEEKLADYIMPDGYTWEFGGTNEEMMESFAGLAFALLFGFLLVYMIMAAQFESLFYPFVIIFSIPIAITGGIFGLFLTGQSVTITAMLGVVMLAGVVVNNAIVLIDYTNLLIKERGYELLQALKLAGPTRLRPILMSTLTTVLGLVPMMVSTSSGSEMMNGLATVVVFGLTLSTVVTLVLIPVIYVIFSNIQEKGRAKKERRMAKKAERLAAIGKENLKNQEKGHNN